MKQIFGKRRVTRTYPGGVKAQPFCRLGALVFQLNNSEKIILGEPSGSDPDSRLCLKPTGFWSPAGKTLSPKAALPDSNCWFTNKRSSRVIARSLPPREKNMATSSNPNDEFIALTMVCSKSTKTNSRLHLKSGAGCSLQIHGPLSARVALLQSPILSARFQSAKPQMNKQAGQ